MSELFSVVDIVPHLKAMLEGRQGDEYAVIEKACEDIEALRLANAEAQSRAVKMMKRALSPEDFEDLTFILGRLARGQQ